MTEAYTLIGLLVSQVSFARSYGGPDTESVRGIVQTTDGGFIVAGETKSFGAGSYDFMAMRLLSTGDPFWVKTLGGTGDDRAFSVALAIDGGCVIVGETKSYGVGDYDVLVMKLGPAGGFRWAKTYGGLLRERGTCIKPTSDTGYILAGWTVSSGQGSADLLVMKMDSAGNRVWTRTFGGDTSDYAHQVIQTQDGGFLVAGTSRSFGAGDFDFLVLKLNSSGTLSWARAIGGPGIEDARILSQTTDNGYIVGGWTNSFGSGDYDVLLVKLNSSGGFQWAKTYGGASLDWGTSGILLPDGGFLVVGVTLTYDPEGDLFLLRLDPAGNPDWLKVLKEEGDGVSGATTVIQTGDGGFAVGGWKGDSWDFLVIKTDQDGNYDEDSNCMKPDILTSLTIMPNLETLTLGASWVPLVSNPNPSQNTPSLTMTNVTCEPVYEEVGESLVEPNDIVCYPIPRAIAFISSCAAEISIYSSDGCVAYSGTLEKGKNMIPIDRGIYFWQAGAYKGKAVVR